jgi:hypothetical protein
LLLEEEKAELGDRIPSWLQHAATTDLVHCLPSDLLRVGEEETTMRRPRLEVPRRSGEEACGGRRRGRGGESSGRDARVHRHWIWPCATLSPTPHPRRQRQRIGSSRSGEDEGVKGR